MLEEAYFNVVAAKRAAIILIKFLFYPLSHTMHTSNRIGVEEIFFSIHYTSFEPTHITYLTSRKKNPDDMGVGVEE